MSTISKSTERVPAVIEATEIHKEYTRGSTRTPVLMGVDFRVDHGEFVFLAGPSGSGKSTLLAIIGTILTPDRGTVNLLGRDVFAMDVADRSLLRRDQIGFVFQRFQLIRGLTALENVLVPCSLRGATTSKDKARARELLDQVGLSERMHNQSNQLSVGECQRVAIARALMNDPQLLLADEPTASLDEENGRQAIELLKDLTTKLNKTAIVVSHDHRVFSYASRISYMHNGTLRSESQEPTRELVGAV